MVAIADRIVSSGAALLATRTNAEMRDALVAKYPGANVNALARTVVVAGEIPAAETVGKILVVSAGTSDLPVAEEAVETVRVMGNEVETLYDVGVAGIHRLLAYRERLSGASVIIVVAGMEGALPSVVGWLGQCAAYCRADQRGIWGEFQGVGSVAGHVEQLRVGRDCGQYRQWIWRGRRSEQDQSDSRGYINVL